MVVWSFNDPQGAGQAFHAKENSFIYQPPRSLWGYGEGEVTKEGAVWLEVTYARGLKVGGGPIETPRVADGATLAAEDPIDVAALVGQGRRLLGNAEDLSAALARGQGALPWLINGPESKRLVRKLSQHLEEISGKVARGDGTVGALLNDPTLYDDLALLLEGAERSRLVRWGIRHEIESGRKGRKERSG